MSGQREGLGAWRLLGAQRAEGRRALHQDIGYAGQSLDIVDESGLAEKSALSREGGLGAGHAALAFNGGDQGGLLAADEGSGALHDTQLEIKAAVKQVRPEQPAFLRLLYGVAHALYRQGVLGTHIDDTLVGFYGLGGDNHALDDGVRVALEQGTVHKGTRVTLVTIADNVFFVALRVQSELPFKPAGEAAAASAAQSGVNDELTDLLGTHFA